MAFIKKLAIQLRAKMRRKGDGGKGDPEKNDEVIRRWGDRGERLIWRQGDKKMKDRQLN